MSTKNLHSFFVIAFIFASCKCQMQGLTACTEINDKATDRFGILSFEGRTTLPLGSQGIVDVNDSNKTTVVPALDVATDTRIDLVADLQRENVWIVMRAALWSHDRGDIGEKKTIVFLQKGVQYFVWNDGVVTEQSRERFWFGGVRGIFSDPFKLSVDRDSNMLCRAILACCDSGIEQVDSSTRMDGDSIDRYVCDKGKLVVYNHITSGKIERATILDKVLLPS